MRELSLHILDLAQNSLTAGASRLDIIVEIDHKKDLVAITLSDDGKGMAPDFLKTVTSPFNGGSPVPCRPAQRGRSAPCRRPY